MDGYWLPQELRRRVLRNGGPMESATMLAGRPAAQGEPGSVTAAWPLLEPAQWAELLAGLAEARTRLPAGPALWERLQAALAAVSRRLADPDQPWRDRGLDALSVYTGYSRPMIGFALQAMSLMALDQMPRAMALRPSGRGQPAWRRFDGLPGRWLFQPAQGLRGRLGLRLRAGRDLFGPVDAPGLLVGYAAGNVPGAALLIAFLGLAAALADGRAAAVLIRNSRQEPIFAPLLLAALEAEDPELVSAVAVMIWDYDDAALQQQLLGRADLVVAAASDETIAEIRRSVLAARPGRPPRFHAHGHKVSFSLIGREVLERGAPADIGGVALLDVVTALAALDSAVWDQHGCLSSRVHFVEQGDASYYSAEEYAAALAGRLRELAPALPRGAWPLHQLHERFDRYKSLEAAGQAQVLSDYGDPFVVVVDRRPWGRTPQAAAAFRTAVNDCQGRTVIVRPVADLAEAPEQLSLLPAANLQSLSVALGRPGEGLSERFLALAAECSRRGVTAIRTAGRGAFPQLAYSWDGLMPLDLVRTRPAGHFTTIEFDAAREQMLATYRALALPQEGSMSGSRLDAVREAASAWVGGIVAPQAADLDRRPRLEFAACDDVTAAWAAVSPDCSYRLVRDALAAAQHELLLYIYNATAPHLLDLLRDALARGVHVRLMVDATDNRGDERQKLAELGVELKEAPSTGGRRVFTVCHQKYAVIDGAILLLGSANWANTSIPKITQPGQFKKGNREWLVRIDHAGLAGWFKELFQADWDIPAVPVPAEAEVLAPPAELPVFALPAAQAPARVFDVRAMGAAGPAVVTPLVSPDNYYETVLGLIAGAQQSIDIEQQYILAGGQHVEGLLAALAGRKHEIAIRALVSPAFRKVGGKDNWELSVETLDAFGLKDCLRAFSLECYSHLHNKGLIVDRQKVVVSSTNWSENSIARAREAGVLIESAELAGYYAEVFDFDWSIAAPADQLLPNAAALVPGDESAPAAEEWEEVDAADLV